MPVAALEIGLGKELEVVHHETSPMRRNQDVFAKAKEVLHEGNLPQGPIPVPGGGAKLSRVSVGYTLIHSASCQLLAASSWAELR